MSELPIGISDHAVERYVERVRPGLGFVAARRELRRLIEAGTLTATAPEWVAESADVSDAYLDAGDVAICLNVDNSRGGRKLVAATVLIRGSLPPLTRERRNKARRARRATRKGRKHGSTGAKPEARWEAA